MKKTSKGRPGRRPIEQITEPQREALEAIQRHINRRGFPPSLSDLGEELGITASSAHERVRQLERKAYVRRDRGKARSLEVLRAASEDVPGLTAVPIVGTIAAGTPILAEENVVGELLVDGHLLRGGRGFALEVDGDSMTGAGIQPGDHVIVRQQPVAESGDIVVALFGDEATVKRLFIAPDRIELRPESPNRRHRVRTVGPDDNLVIQGRVVGVRRSQQPPASKRPRRRR